MPALRSWLVSLAALLALECGAQAQDIGEFWAQTRAELARVPMAARVEVVNEPLPFRKFRVTLRSLGGVELRAFLALPISGEAPAKPWPVIVTVPGYGGTQQGVMLGECLRGYAILQVFPRGQGESAGLWQIDGPDKLTWHLARPAGAYYQGAYADVIRSIDYVVSRPDLDPQRIGLVGTSQGGGIALAVGALDGRVKTVIAHLPFLCAVRLAARTPGSLVKKLLDAAGQNQEGAWRTLDYFDPLQLAPRLNVPVMVSAGGRDETCPAATIHAVYAALPGIKALVDYPGLAHTSSFAFYNLTWPWLDLYLRTPAP